MKTQLLPLHCYAQKEGDQWSAICLNFTLAAQGSTLEEAKGKLVSMIKEYVQDALEGEDKAYKSYFLARRAP